eukprot:PITA_35421
MASSGKIEIEKFNGQIFELWKLKMEDLLADKDQWIAVDPGTKPTGVTDEEWKKLDRKAKSTIRLCVLDSVLLLNVSGEATAKALWDKLGTLYQSKSLVNKLFLRKKLYNLRMKDGDSVTEHLNAFNTVVNQLSSVDIQISDEDKCISLLCSLLDLWDSLVIAIGSNATALQFDEIVSALLTEEMRRKNMDNQNGDALSVRGRSQNRKKKVIEWEIKYRGRSKSLGKPYKGGVLEMRERKGNFRRECKSKAPDKGKGYDDAPSTEAKTTSDEGGDVCKDSVREGYLQDGSRSTSIDAGVRIGTLYKLQGSTVVDGCNSSMVPEKGAENLVVSGEKNMLWNQRLGHIGEKGLQYFMVKNRVSFPSGGKRMKQILELVHNDVFGPMNVPSLGNSVYYVSFIDDFSRNRWTYFLKKKSEVFDKFKEFKALVENQTKKKIKMLRTDNGGEFCSKEYEEFYKKCG